MSKLMERAKKELKLSGVDQDIYGDMTSKAVLELLEVFDSQGHSGASAGFVSQLFIRLVRNEALSPLTDDPNEWVEVGEDRGGPFWQNKRQSSAFSQDQGKTYYVLEEKRQWVSRLWFMLPQKVKTAYAKYPHKLVYKFHKSSPSK